MVRTRELLYPDLVAAQFHLRMTFLAVPIFGALTFPDALASERAQEPALYKIVVETTMPHLEENLRYTKKMSEECLTRSELLVRFPILTEGAFDECGLSQQMLSDSEASYRLICPASTGTTGNAVWRFNASHLAGTLEVKLGGKNMTFHQRVTAKRVGECISTSE